MKLVIDCRMIDMGGIGTYLRNLLPEIINSGMFDVICMGYPNLKKESWFASVRYIEMKSRILSLGEQIELFFKTPACDIFWSPNWNIPVLPIRANKRVVTIHDVYHLANPQDVSRLKLFVIRNLLRQAHKRSGKVITVSEFSKNEILKYTTCDPSKISVIYLGIDHIAPKPIRQPTTENYILYVGNVKPHKNLLLALKAFNRISDGATKFYIVGKKDGFITGYKNLGDIVSENSANVVFTGHVTEKELMSYYAGARIFLFPSKYEGFGLPVLEAMKFHLNIVASNAGAIYEVAGDTVCYFDPESEQDLAEKLQMVMTGKFLFDFNLYETQLKKYNWANAAAAHIAALSK